MVTAREFVATAAGRLVLDLQQLNLEHQGSAARDLGRGATSAVAEAGWDDQLALGWHDQNKQTCKRKVTFNAKASAPSAQQTETYTLADAHAHKPLVPALQTHTRRHTSTHTRSAPTTQRPPSHPRHLDHHASAQREVKRHVAVAAADEIHGANATRVVRGMATGVWQGRRQNRQLRTCCRIWSHRCTRCQCSAWTACHPSGSCAGIPLGGASRLAQGVEQAVWREPCESRQVRNATTTALPRTYAQLRVSGEVLLRRGRCEGSNRKQQ